MSERIFRVSVDLAVRTDTEDNALLLIGHYTTGQPRLERVRITAIEDTGQVEPQVNDWLLDDDTPISEDQLLHGYGTQVDDLASRRRRGGRAA